MENETMTVREALALAKHIHETYDSTYFRPSYVKAEARWAPDDQHVLTETYGAATLYCDVSYDAPLPSREEMLNDPAADDEIDGWQIYSLANWERHKDAYEHRKKAASA